MEWYTHPYFVKYEVNYCGEIRNKRTKKVLKAVFGKNYAKPRVSVFDYAGRLRQRAYGAFVLEAINNVKNIEDFLNLDGDVFNNNYFNLKETQKKSKGRAVAQISMTGTVIKTWNSLSEARDLGGFCDKSIILACQGKIKSHGGYVWCYEKDIPSTKVTLLVASKEGEVNYFGSTKQAYIFFKSRNLVSNEIPRFRTNVSRTKNRDKLFLGYRWATVDKYIES